MIIYVYLESLRGAQRKWSFIMKNLITEFVILGVLNYKLILILYILLNTLLIIEWTISQPY